MSARNTLALKAATRGRARHDTDNPLQRRRRRSSACHIYVGSDGISQVWQKVVQVADVMGVAASASMVMHLSYDASLWRQRCELLAQESARGRRHGRRATGC